jgi:hypothetical protein
MTDETGLADLLEFVLSGRPERMTDLAVSQMQPEGRAALRAVTETAASLGLAWRAPRARKCGRRSLLRPATAW